MEPAPEQKVVPAEEVVAVAAGDAGPQEKVHQVQVVCDEAHTNDHDHGSHAHGEERKLVPEVSDNSFAFFLLSRPPGPCGRVPTLPPALQEQLELDPEANYLDCTNQRHGRICVYACVLCWWVVGGVCEGG